MRVKAPRFSGLEVASLFFLMILAVSIRLMGIEERCLWSDEVVQLGYNSGGFLEDLRRIVAVDIHPPLYYLLQRFIVDLFDSVPLGLRALSLASSVATVALVFLLGRRMFGFRAGLAAGLFLALQPSAILQAQTARMYALGGFAMLLAVLALRRLEEGRPRAVPALGAALAFGLYVDWPLALGQFALLLPALLARERTAKRGILAACLLAALAVSPLVAANAFARIGEHAATEKFLTMELARAPWTAVPETFLAFTVETDLPPLRPLVLALLLPLFLLLARDGAESRAASAIWCAATLPPLLLYLASELFVASGATPLYVSRGVFFATGPLALWIGFLVSRIGGGKSYLFLLCALAVTLSFQNQATNFHYLDRGWREDAKFLDRHAKSAPRFYPAPWFLDDELRFYRSDLVRPIGLSPESVGIRTYLDMFRRHAVPRGSVEAWLAREISHDTNIVFLAKDLECALGDGAMLDHDRAALDWLKANRHIHARHVSHLPNGRGRHDLYLFGRDPVDLPRERSVAVSVDVSRLPLVGRLVANPVATLFADGNLAYRFKTEDFEHGPDGVLSAYAFVPVESFQWMTGAVALDRAAPLPTLPALSAALAYADRAARGFLGADLLDLCELPWTSGEDPRKVLPVLVVPDPSADPLLRLLVFLLGSAALLFALASLAAATCGIRAA